MLRLYTKEFLAGTFVQTCFFFLSKAKIDYKTLFIRVPNPTLGDLKCGMHSPN
jgi:hypothetical protein